jgi:hypothetical protein
VFVSHDASWWQVVLPALWAFSMRLTCEQQSEELEVVLGAAVSLGLAQARLTTKEAAALMRVDESQLRHSLRGSKGYHFSLNRLARLPFAFWLHFGPALIYLLAKKNITEIAEDFKRSA